MSYIETTKKEAKKMLSLLKGKSKEELVKITEYPSKDLYNILAKAKGFNNFEHFSQEIEQPTLNEETHTDSFFQFNKDDVINDIYPEFIPGKLGYEENKDKIEHNKVSFLGEKISSLDDRIVLFHENIENKRIYNQLINGIRGTLIIGQGITHPDSFNSDILISIHNEKHQETIDPLNPFLNDKEFFKQFSPRIIPLLMTQVLKNNLIVKLKSFKGFLNLNYLIKQEDSYTREYLKYIGISENNEITESAIKKHLFYAREALIFAKILIDYDFCFSEQPTFRISRNNEEKNVLIKIIEPILSFDREKEADYKASEILKRAVLSQVYTGFKNETPYALIALFNINSEQYKSSIKNTILINNNEYFLHTKNCFYNEVVISIESKHYIPFQLKEFILRTNTYRDFMEKDFSKKTKIHIKRNSISDI